MAENEKRGPSSAYGKLHQAIQTLASHPGRIRERLTAACEGGLFEVHEGDFPAVEMREQWHAIRSRIHGVGTGVIDNDFEQAINALPEEVASQVAEELIGLADALNRWLD